MNNVLLENIKKGDNDAFAALYNEHADYALRVAMAVTGSKASAEDF